MGNYNIITLGTTCFSRYITTKAGLKPTREQGELTMPFDLAVHVADYIPQVISTNFKGYLEDIRIDSSGIFEIFHKESFFSKPKRVAWLNHDNDLRGDKTKLIERYSRRIDNFLKFIKEDKPIIFVQTCEHPYNCKKLIKAIEGIRGQMPYKILFIEIGCNLGIKNNNNIHVFKTNFPYPNYVWHEDAHRNTQEGVDFENLIITELQTQCLNIDFQ